MKFLPASLVSLGLLSGTASAADPVDYTRDVKPILAKHCVSCHGEERPRAGLRLDTAALAIKGGKAGPAVVPGKAEESSALPRRHRRRGNGDGCP